LVPKRLRARRAGPPDIVEAILGGRQPDGMTLAGLMEPFPVEWERQRSTLAQEFGYHSKLLQ